MKLYDSKPMTKLAMMTKLSEDVGRWTSDITNIVYEQLPFLSGREIQVDLQRIDEEKKSGIGMVRAVAGKKMVGFPVIIKQAEMCPLDVMLIDGQFIPASEQTLNQYFFDPSLFERSKKRDPRTMNRSLDPSVFPFNAAMNDYSQVSQKVAATLSVDRYKQLIEKNAQEKLGLNFDKYAPLEKQASKKELDLNAFILYFGDQDIPEGIGIVRDPYTIAHYRNDTLSKTAEEVFKDSEEDTMLVGDGEGLYFPEDLQLKSGRVQIPRAGEGYLFTKVIDFSGRVVPTSIYISPEYYAMQEKVAGVQMSDKVDVNDPTMGRGIFYFEQDNELISTTPVNIQSKSGKFLNLVDSLGRAIKLAFSSRLTGLTKVDPETFVLPRSAKFIRLPEKMEGLPKVSAEAVHETKRVSITRGDKGYTFKGDPVNEVKTQVKNMPEKIAQVTLLALGATPFQVKKVMAVADNFKTVNVFTDKQFKTEVRPDPEKLASLQKVTDYLGSQISLNDLAVINKYYTADQIGSISKKAEIQAPEELVDNLLSLNFVNPDNIILFVEQLPELKKSASTLSSILMASRLGMSTVPEQAVSSTIRNLTQVIRSLELLQTSHTDK